MPKIKDRKAEILRDIIGKAVPKGYIKIKRIHQGYLVELTAGEKRCNHIIHWVNTIIEDNKELSPISLDYSWQEMDNHAVGLDEIICRRPIVRIKVPQELIAKFVIKLDEYEFIKNADHKEESIVRRHHHFLITVKQHQVS